MNKPNEITTSTNPRKTVDRGIINLGKNTLVTRLEFITILILIFSNDWEKNNQTITPGATTSVKGIVLSVSNEPIFPNANAMTMVVINGRKTLQPTPRIVCLYLTKISLLARIQSNSLDCQMSRM